MNHYGSPVSKIRLILNVNYFAPFQLDVFEMQSSENVQMLQSA